MEGHIYVASSSSSGVHMGLAPQEKAREEEEDGAGCLWTPLHCRFEHFGRKKWKNGHIGKMNVPYTP